MWFDGIRQPNTLYVASVSRGKDSTAMLRAIQLMGWPLDAICSVDIWFDDDTPAELPPMVAFKDEWDAKCLDWFGVPVTRMCATQKSGEKRTYCDIFYQRVSPEREKLRARDGLHRPAPSDGSFSTYGFPFRVGSRCTDLKTSALTVWRIKRAVIAQANLKSKTSLQKAFSSLPKVDEGQKINIVIYVGIAADEPKRITRHIVKPNKVLPLVQIGWDEALCGLEATYMDMLSPTYDGSFRDGCWFCHNQGVGQLRNLRKNYQELWQKLMKIDLDSPVTFHADGHTVHDFDKRFQWEDDGFLQSGKQFRWEDIDEPQTNIWQMEVIV